MATLSDSEPFFHIFFSFPSSFFYLFSSVMYTSCWVFCVVARWQFVLGFALNGVSACVCERVLERIVVVNGSYIKVYHKVVWEGLPKNYA